jgi:hypothetical protein
MLPEACLSLAHTLGFQVYEQGRMIVVIHRPVKEFGHDMGLHQATVLVAEAAELVLV